MSLEQDLPKIFEFFEMEPEEKALNFQSTVANAIRFSEKLQEVYKNGSQEEKEQIHDILDEMREKISQETKKLYESLGLTEEELVAYIDNPDNFSAEEWALLQDANKKLENSRKEFAYRKQPQIKKSKGKLVSKKEWIHS
jgi:hypothetical protein